MTTDAWNLQAACLGLAREQGSFDIFFEEGMQAQAKAICANCDVRLECLNDAITNHEYYGIRGGLNPKERESVGRRWKYWAKRTTSPKPLLEWIGETA